jgi:hypothetical protein
MGAMAKAATFFHYLTSFPSVLDVCWGGRYPRQTPRGSAFLNANKDRARVFSFRFLPASGFNDMKPWAEKFYKSSAWLRCRAGYISKVGGLCEKCYSRGIYRAGVIVHHKIPLTKDNITDPRITLNWDNLELVCRDCHAEEHNGRPKRYEVGPDGKVTGIW